MFQKKTATVVASLLFAGAAIAGQVEVQKQSVKTQQQLQQIKQTKQTKQMQQQGQQGKEGQQGQQGQQAPRD